MSENLITLIQKSKLHNSDVNSEPCRNCAIFFNENKSEIWEAFLCGATRLDIYRQLLAIDKFAGSYRTFLSLFRKAFPHADDIRTNHIKATSQSITGFDSEKYEKEKKALETNKIKINNKESSTKEKVKKEKSTKKSSSQKNKNNKEVNNSIVSQNTSIDTFPKEENKNNFEQIVDKQDLESTKDKDEDKEFNVIINKLPENAEPWDPAKSHGDFKTFQHDSDISKFAKEEKEKWLKKKSDT